MNGRSCDLIYFAKKNALQKVTLQYKRLWLCFIGLTKQDAIAAFCSIDKQSADMGVAKSIERTSTCCIQARIFGVLQRAITPSTLLTNLLTWTWRFLIKIMLIQRSNIKLLLQTFIIKATVANLVTHLVTELLNVSPSISSGYAISVMLFV